MFHPNEYELDKCRRADRMHEIEQNRLAAGAPTTPLLETAAGKVRQFFTRRSETSPAAAHPKLLPQELRF